MTRRVVVVGAGIGGLTAGAELAHDGNDVTVVDAAETPGGKLREIVIDGRPVDSGPTVVTMRWVYDELFDALGTSTDAELQLDRAQRIARHVWSADEQLDLFADLQESAAAIEAFAGAREAQGFLRFSRDAEQVYRSLLDTFMRASRPGVLELCRRFGPAGIGKLFRLRPYSSLWNVLGDYFSDPRLRQLFARYAGYCGSSPFLAPATLMLVAHAEREGIWLARGGMYRIVEALANQLTRHGGRLRMNSRVQRVLREGSRVSGVELAGGERLPADAVIWNGDVAALAGGLAGEDIRRAAAPVQSPQRSMSALAWSMLATTEGMELLRHTVFFSADYRREFEQIFADRQTPAAPTVYVCAQDRDDAGQGSPGQDERLLLIVNVPADGDTRTPTAAEAERCTTTALEHLERCGLTLHHRPAQVQLTTPADFERLFPASGGALYGRASHGWLSSFRRAGARTPIRGLYLAGGSTHPGPGVPMAMLSGRQAAACIRTDSASTRR